MTEYKDMTVRHMRTINEAAQYIKAVDPDTAITKCALRRFVTGGEIPSVRIGNKYLVALEDIEECLKQGINSAGRRFDYGKIRPVEVRR